MFKGSQYHGSGHATVKSVDLSYFDEGYCPTTIYFTSQGFHKLYMLDAISGAIEIESWFSMKSRIKCLQILSDKLSSNVIAKMQKATLSVSSARDTHQHFENYQLSIEKGAIQI